MKQPVMRTLHRPDRDRGTKGGKCTGSYPECAMHHYFAVPAIQVRGTWTIEESASFRPLTGKSAR